MKINSYSRILERISKALSPHEQATVRRIFSWLICVRRPLRIVELEHALLIHPGDNKIQYTRMLRKDILELCGPIVEIRKDYITFIHFSAKEYAPSQTFRFSTSIWNAELIFIRYLTETTKNSPDDSCGIRKAESHAEVAVTCLSYLSFRYFDGGITDEEVDGFIGSGGYVLHQYSQTNFLHHIRGALRDARGASEILRASTREFLKARWNPSRQVDSELPLSSMILGHIQTMGQEDYKKLRIIAAHLRTRHLTESTKGLFLSHTRITDC